MKTAGPIAEVVDRTDRLETADTVVRTDHTAKQAAKNIAVSVDDGDVDDTAAATAAVTYLRVQTSFMWTDAHTLSINVL